jgi:V/A-type H+-transporting ATPase subunit D
MTEETASRSRMLALREERRAMQEGYVFLDEKCLVLAGAMLRELREQEQICQALAPLERQAAQSLRRALSRHGLQGLQCYPPGDLPGSMIEVQRRSLLGIALEEASLQGEPPVCEQPVYDSPEARSCRAAHVALIRSLVALAARAANIERLYREYRRTMRRAHAIQDVLLPEVSRAASGMEAYLEEQEREEALWARRGFRRG